MYCLRAVIAPESVLRELTATLTKARIVPLGQHLSLLPMTDALLEAVTVVGAPEFDGFWNAPAGFDRVLAACSATGPLAYVDADYCPPISQALRRLGATKGNHFDEFDAVGLGRHRDTDNWLPPTS